MKNLVLVDDSADQLELMELAIMTLGIARTVSTFTSGEDCLAAIESGALQPGLILLDVNMPGLDGPATAARMRRLAAARLATIVMMSTSDRSEDVRRAREAGADSYIMKPVGNRSWTDVMASVAGYWFDTDLNAFA
jgi:CheY-like chemotaxis protein